ncbi:hypothetical protein FRC18_007511 [Serendipita sp. 400]|nr:hypothetical protein FRC18_007511 [Serendipita sp. 400]
MGKKRKTDNKPVNEDKGSARTSSDVPRANTATNGGPDGILPPPQQQDAIPSAGKGKGKEKEDGERTEKEGGKEEEEEKVEDKSVEADRLKEQGNVAFKAGRYDEAVTRYTDAIALVSSQAAYYGNRAAAYISLKQFRLALEDCQQAKSLQQASPQLKTLLRLARCQLATGSPSPALSTLREAQALEGGGGGTTNRDLWQLKTNAETMQRHLDSVAKARAKRDWSTASAALEAARRGLEGGEGRDVPTEWRCWAVELKMARGDWNGAMEAVKDAQRYEGNSPDIYALRGQVLFLTNKPAESTSILRHAISLDPENATARRMLKRVKELEKIKEDGNAAFKYSKWEEAGGDEEKFKLVVEAHAVLSDPDKRERYDSGEDIDGQMNSGAPGAGFPGGVDINDILFAQESTFSRPGSFLPNVYDRCLEVQEARGVSHSVAAGFQVTMGVEVIRTLTRTLILIRVRGVTVSEETCRFLFLLSSPFLSALCYRSVYGIEFRHKVA